MTSTFTAGTRSPSAWAFFYGIIHYVGPDAGPAHPPSPRPGGTPHAPGDTSIRSLRTALSLDGKLDAAARSPHPDHVITPAGAGRLPGTGHAGIAPSLKPYLRSALERAGEDWWR